jgi:hypothetical protein
MIPRTRNIKTRRASVPFLVLLLLIASLAIPGYFMEREEQDMARAQGEYKVNDQDDPPLVKEIDDRKVLKMYGYCDDDSGKN